MATFKVGQRVKYVSGLLENLPIGSEGYIESFDEDMDCVCVFPTCTCLLGYRGRKGVARVYRTSIVPLTDPKADEFLERIRKMEREPLGTVLGNKIAV